MRRANAELHKPLEEVAKGDLIPRNPAVHANKPKARQEDIGFLDTARGDRFEALYVLCLTCGLRQGEGLALRWQDIDLEGATLRVNRQLQRVRGGGGLRFSEPKNASRRTVDLPRTALVALKRHRKKQLEEKLKAGGAYEYDGLVFATAKGTPLDAQNVVNRRFKPLLRSAGLPDIRWHDLRHSCFTLLLSRGVHPKYVQHLAGHASIQLTLDRYSHWMPSMGKHTASAMDEALDEADREHTPEGGKDVLEG